MSRKILFYIKILLAYIVLSSVFAPINSFAISDISQENINIISKVNESIIDNSKFLQSLNSPEIIDSLKNRKDLMYKLMKENTSLFLNFAINNDKKSKLSIEIQKYLESEININGFIEMNISEDFENHGNNDEDNTLYYISDGKNKYEFYQTSIGDFKSGDRIKANGYIIDNRFVLISNINLNKKDNIKLSSTRIEGKNYAIGEQKTLVILAKMNSNINESMTIDMARKAVFEGQFQKFMNEQSNGKVSFSGDVYGYYNFNHNFSPGCALPPLEDTLKVFDTYKINPEKYTRIVYLIDGIGSAGCSNIGMSHILYNGSLYYISTAAMGIEGYVGSPNSAHPFKWIEFDNTLSHEMGHSLGLTHANGLSCIKEAIQGDCKNIEYGGIYDDMGTGDKSLHYNAYYKYLLGWLSPEQITTVTNSGNYEISPQENGSKSRLIKIDITNTPKYFIEMRAPYGFDAKLSKSDSIANTSGLFIYSIGRANRETGANLIDMSPANNTNHNDWEKNIAQVTLNRPELKTSLNQLIDTNNSINIGPITNTSIRTNNTSESTINVDITINGIPVCKRADPNLYFSDFSNIYNAGDTGTGNMSIKNMDTSTCQPSEFEISLLNSPIDWTTTFNKKITISPNLLVNNAYSFDIPEDTKTGDYKFTYQIKNLNTGSIYTVNKTYHINAKIVPLIPLEWNIPNLIKAGHPVPAILNFKGNEIIGEQSALIRYYDKDGISKFSNGFKLINLIKHNDGTLSLPVNLKIAGDVPSGTYTAKLSLITEPKSQSALASLSSIAYEVEIGKLNIAEVDQKIPEYKLYYMDGIDNTANGNSNIPMNNKKNPELIINTAVLANEIPKNLYKRNQYIDKVSDINNSLPNKTDAEASLLTILPWNGPIDARVNSQISFNLLFRGGPTRESKEIFVHFIDENNNIKFVSDIMPETPTTKWSGIVNIPIRVYIPKGIALGNYTVVAGLYSGNNREILGLSSGVSMLNNDKNKYIVGKLNIVNENQLINTLRGVNNYEINTVTVANKIKTNSTDIKQSNIANQISVYESPTPTPTSTPTPTYYSSVSHSPSENSLPVSTMIMSNIHSPSENNSATPTMVAPEIHSANTVSQPVPAPNPSPISLPTI